MSPLLAMYSPLPEKEVALPSKRGEFSRPCWAVCGQSQYCCYHLYVSMHLFTWVIRPHPTPAFADVSWGKVSCPARDKASIAVGG